MSENEKDKAMLRLLDSIEMSQRSVRMQAARSILYLVQGIFGECLTLDQQADYSRANIFLLYDYGIFYTFVQLLNMEIEYVTIFACLAFNIDCCILTIFPSQITIQWVKRLKIVISIFLQILRRTSNIYFYVHFTLDGLLTVLVPIKQKYFFK